MGHVDTCFATISEVEILQIPEDAVAENKRRPQKNCTFL